MKQLFTLTLILLLSFGVSAQLSDGSIAPDFTLDDWQWGETHNLQDYLDQGKSVVLDFGATWCAPCWSYHQGGTLDALYEDFGPNGTDQIMVFMVEGDGDTTQPCIEGTTNCSGGTQGDWTNGVSYPILNPPAAAADDIASDYSIAFWPTLYGVAPNGEIYEIGQAGYDEWESYLVGSFLMANTSYEIIQNGCSFDVDVTLGGAAGNVEYEWSNGATTEDLFLVSGETYFVTITDENNFEIELGPIDVPFGDGHELIYDETSSLFCNNDFSGTIEVEAEGGSNSFYYDWSNGANGSIIDGLESGDYYLTITDQNNGCTSETYFYVEEPDELEVEFEIIDAGCNETGEVFIDASGGTGAYTYSFDGFSSTFNEIELEAGIYEVTISDLNDCELVSSFVVEATEAPTASSSSNGNISCTTPTVTLSSSGSATGSDIDYYWYDSSYNLLGTGGSISVSNGGTYTLEVVDDVSGCSSFSELSVAVDNMIPTAASTYSNAIDCTNTTATLSGAGSTEGGDVTYTWSTSDGNILTDATQLTVEVGSGGTYTLSIIDNSSGCSSSSSVLVPSNGNVPSATVSGATNFCANSSTQICLTTEAGNSVSWSIDGVQQPDTGTCITVTTSGVIEATVTNAASGCSTTQVVQTTASPAPNSTITGESSFCAGASTNLCVTLGANETAQWSSGGQNIGTSNCITVTSAGSYLASVSTAEGCQSTTEMVVSTLATPTVNITGNTILCDSSTTTLCTDDVADHTYQWTGPNGEVLATGACVQVSTGGVVSVTSTNNSNCATTSQSTLISESSPTISVSQPGLLDCNTSEVTLSATTTGSELRWFDASGTLVGQGNSISTNLAGNYTCTSQSANGCMTTESVTVEQDNNALPTSAFSSSVTDFTIDFLSQSTGDVTSYEWDFGDGTTSTEENPTHTFTSGEYNVCLTVTNDCGSNSTCELLSFSDALTVNINATSIVCFGENTGTIDLNITGGTAPYTIVSDPDIGTSQNFDGLGAGEYSISVEDANGDNITSTVIIQENSEISVTGASTPTTAGNNEGSLTASVTGGTAPYTYEWSNGETTAIIAGLAAGSYSVIITDASGCAQEGVYVVDVISAVKEIEIVEEFSYGPNPASDQINVRLKLSQSTNVKLQILNSVGVSVYDYNINTDHNIDVSNFANGVYFMHLSHGNQSITKKVLIVR